MSDKHVICPWCGGEMVPPFKFPICYARPRAYHCDDCGAIAPTPLLPEKTSGSNVRKAAYAAAQHRYEPPVKPLTWDEAITDDYYLEQRGDQYIDVALNVLAMTTDWPNPSASDCIHFVTHSADDVKLMRADYGKTWRCWPRKPNEEERSAAKWED